MVRCGVAEEIGARQSLEDANVTLDNLAAGCSPDSADAPCAFYAVRGRVTLGQGAGAWLKCREPYTPMWSKCAASR